MDFGSMAKYIPLFVEGLKVTIEISFVAVIIGVIIGLAIALFKLSGVKILSFIATLYIQIIRGTPVIVQLFIIYYSTYPLFGFNIPPYIAAIIAFGFNSGAYVAEIIRAGIQAVDYGQMEAGRSLGMTYGRVMRHIIIPQGIKNILPALGNEFIVLLKETSVVSIIGTADLVRQADIIRAATYSSFEPYIIIAIIYLILVLGLSSVMDKVERRLKKSDYR